MTPTPTPSAGWLPIETAPKDGTKIKLRAIGCYVQAPITIEAEGSWEKGMWLVDVPVMVQPLHWQPLSSPNLPAAVPPEAAKGGGALIAPSHLYKCDGCGKDFGYSRPGQCIYCGGTAFTEYPNLQPAAQPATDLGGVEVTEADKVETNTILIGLQKYSDNQPIQKGLIDTPDAAVWLRNRIARHRDAAVREAVRDLEGEIIVLKAQRAVHRDKLSTAQAESRRYKEALDKALPVIEAGLFHEKPESCWATGPMTGDPIEDLIVCPGCRALEAVAAIRTALAPAAKEGNEGSGKCP